MAFVRSYNPIWNFRDLTGLPLDDTYYAFFVENVFPYAPQAPFRDLNGATVWTGGIVQFSAAGTLPDNLYFDDSLVYRIEIRQGNMSSDPLIWLIENYVPASSGGGSSPTATNIVSSNQITNPEFVDRFFTDGYSTSDNLVNIAPGWQFVGTGGGTVTFNLVDLSGASNVPLQPAFALRITTSGKITAVLRQRIDNNGALFQTGGGANSAIGASLLAIDNLGGSPILSVDYLDSNGTLINLINDTYTGAWDNKINSVALTNTPPNPDLNSVAYVDIDISLPGTGDVSVSAVQIVKQITPDTTNLQYQGQTPARQRDHTWHVFREPVLNKNLESILVGWDFPLNPVQYSGNTTYSAANISTTANYFWDQTILQTSGGTATLIRNAVTGGIQITTGAATQAVLFCQYLDGQQAKKILNTPLSVNISGWRTSASGTVTPRVYLLRGSSAATFPVVTSSLLGSVAANGSFSLTAANWTEIPKIGITNANGELSSVDTTNYATLNNVEDLKYEYFMIQDASQISNTDKFAIVVTFECPTTETVFTIDSISCVQSRIATRPMYKEVAQTLQDCRYYFEKSYSNNVLPGTPTTSDARYERMQLFGVGTTTAKWHNRSFTINYEYKRIAPTVRFYSTTGAEGVTNWNHLRNFVSLTYTALANPQNISMAFFTIVPFNDSMQLRALYTSTNIVSGTLSSTFLSALDELVMAYHYTLDSRIGK